MINRNTISFVKCSVSAVALVAISVGMTACSEEEAAPVAVAPPPPPPPSAPPPPAVTPIDQLMAMLNIDPRVHLPEDKAPDNDIDRKAVLVFFDAFARGDSKSVKSMLPLTDQLELTALVDDGSWKKSVSQIQSIDVQTGGNSLGQKCALAVIEVGEGTVTNFQPQMWYYTADAQSNLFEAAPTPPGIIDKLSGDWITAWHRILAEELALADRPEEIIDPLKRNLDTGSDSPMASGGAPPRGLKPVQPGTQPEPFNPIPTGH